MFACLQKSFYGICLSFGQAGRVLTKSLCSLMAEIFTLFVLLFQIIQARGCAFVTMGSSSAAKKVKETLDGQKVTLDNSAMTLKVSREKQPILEISSARNLLGQKNW